MRNRIVVQAGQGSLPRLPRHTNPGLEIVVMLRGRVEWEVEGKRWEVPAGSAFFTLPWQRHGSAAEFEPGHAWAFAVISAKGDARRGLRLAPGLGLSAAEHREAARRLQAASGPVWPASETLRHALLELASEARPEGSEKVQRTLAGARISALARLAVIELLRCLNQPVRTGGELRVARLLRELETEFDRSWTLAEMAARCGLGRTRFATVFLQETGDPPMTYLNRLRIARARAWLRGTRHPITRIAFDCGFASSQYFARVFRAFTGMDARSYRAEGSLQ